MALSAQEPAAVLLAWLYSAFSQKGRYCHVTCNMASSNTECIQQCLELTRSINTNNYKKKDYNVLKSPQYMRCICCHQSWHL